MRVGLCHTFWHELALGCARKIGARSLLQLHTLCKKTTATYRPSYPGVGFEDLRTPGLGIQFVPGLCAHARHLKHCEARINMLLFTAPINPHPPAHTHTKRKAPSHSVILTWPFISWTESTALKYHLRRTHSGPVRCQSACALVGKMLCLRNKNKSRSEYFFPPHATINGIPLGNIMHSSLQGKS